jgi:hypothetical protein
MTLGEMAYNSYCETVEWQSLSGEGLPEWEKVRPEIKIAWERAAQAVVEEITKDTELE